MKKYTLVEQVQRLRRQGKSMRGIALQLDLHPSKIQRLVAKLSDASSRSAFGSLQDDFVGRERELAILWGALHDAISGNGKLVMLTGEPDFGTPTSRAKGLPIKIL